VNLAKYWPGFSFVATMHCMKKILIFSLAYYPKFVGGAEVAIKEITDRTAPQEYEFHMVTLKFDSNLPKQEKIGNVMIHRIGFSKASATISDLQTFPLKLNKPLFQFLAFFEAVRLHFRYHFDATWAMMAHSTGVPAGLFKTFFPKVSYLLTLQEGDPIDYILKKMQPIAPLFKRAFTKADIVQPISTFLGSWAKQMGYSGTLEIIPNAVNTKHFAQAFSGSELAPIKEILHKKEGETLMITTSRLVTKNAVDDCIRALPLLPDAVRFIVLGIGPDEEMLKQLAHELGVADRVMFLGQVDHTEMPKYLKASEIFIRPSLSEGMGNSFVEAMAAELPVIATQEGGIADFLFDPVLNPDKAPTGRAVKPRDPEGIAKAVIAFVTDTDATRAIVANAKKLAFEKYDWDLIAKDMKERVFSKL